MIGVIVNAKVPTPRSLDYSAARQVLETAQKGVAKVAVVMPGGLDEVLEIVEELDPDYLQIHTSLPLSELRVIRKEISRELINVFPVPRHSGLKTDMLKQAKNVADLSDIILLDTQSPMGGGSGTPHDWSVSCALRERLKIRVFLAGGLNPLNVGRAIKEVGPFGVDVSSGVETSPGIKAPERIRKFVRASRDGY
jgi:phosphoribosylanthranilate isomerase